MKVIVNVRNSAIPPWSTIVDSLREVLPGLTDCRVNGLNTEASFEVGDTAEQVGRALKGADFVVCWRFDQ